MSSDEGILVRGPQPVITRGRPLRRRLARPVRAAPAPDRRSPGSPANLHCCAADSDEVAEYRLLRVYLRAHPDARAEYEAVKRSLAGRPCPDMNRYADAKGPTIEALLRRARARISSP